MRFKACVNRLLEKREAFIHLISDSLRDSLEFLTLGKISRFGFIQEDFR